MSNDYSKYYKKPKADVTNVNKKPKVEANRDNLDIAEVQKLDKTIFDILLAVLAILPLLTRTKVIDFSSPLVTNSSIGSGTVGDVFTYYKFTFLVIATSLLLILFLYRTFGIGVPIKKSFINIPLAVLAIFVTLSALFAPYKSLALVGMYNRHEGAISYLCYFSLFFIAANVTYTKKMLHNVIYALYPVTIVNAILGLLAFYGVELINSSFLKAILLPKGITEDMIGAGSRFITTINHPNYVSGFSAVLLVIYLMMFILDKHKIRQIVNGIFAVLSFAMMLSSLSLSGFLTFVIMLPVIIVLLLGTTSKTKAYLKLAAQIIIFTVVFILMASNNPKVWDETIGFVTDNNPFNKDEQVLNSRTLENVTYNNDQIMKKIKQKVVVNPFNNVVFAETNAIETNESNNEFELPKLGEPAWAPGTGRLYIWEKAFELVKERPIFGYGLDTFMFYFPQHEIDKITNLYEYNTLVDKPHNLYVNMAYGGGVIAFLSLITLIGTVLLNKIKLLFTNLQVSIALFAGCLAYVLQGFFNDSVIGTAPLFWILLGVFSALKTSK